MPVPSRPLASLPQLQKANTVPAGGGALGDEEGQLERSGRWMRWPGCPAAGPDTSPRSLPVAQGRQRRRMLSRHAAAAAAVDAAAAGAAAPAAAPAAAAAVAIAAGTVAAAAAGRSFGGDDFFSHQHAVNAPCCNEGVPGGPAVQGSSEQGDVKQPSWQ